ncbi:PqiC family protein [Wenxinia saemankumensis]|uniref:ABC-type transport auxiliary lipoprotein component domain-containing protein n=1 Tax=Wenxinia saemankumensis TaxID=1447782 RepID=A0A1M6A8K7_9RHOB|nr:ABC-type transport auxiliary lipoprotein family protein [Wenxinia saemankumensis]SHI32812.1 hypothetical protein SAMN05444417_0295 [Wenxinia saemankumensis]
MMTRLLAPGLLLLLAACGDPALRYAVPQVTPAERVSIGFSSVEVRDVELPLYAQSEEIYVEDETGALVSSTDLLWADDPSRASTLELARALSSLTGVVVAPEPWPFDLFPAARVEVRVEEFVASRAGAFRLSGQYFIAALDESGRDRARLFELSAPLPAEAGPAEIAAARAAAMAQLAETIARDGLR